MRLRDDAAGELPAPESVVALAARQVDLPLPAVERRAAGVKERLCPRVDRHVDRQPARLARDVRREREQVPALPRERRRLLSIDATAIDALLEIDRPARSGVERGIAGGDAFHGLRRIAVAVRAGLANRPGLLLPQRLAVEDEQHAGIRGVVVLHRARLA